MAEPIEVDMDFPRGDTYPYAFQLEDANKQPLNLNVGDGEIYLTVKLNQNKTEPIFQKRFSNGGILRDEERDGYYYTVFQPDDTNTMKYGKYGYDVTVKIGTYVKTLIIGTIELTNEYTHKSNE